jgi:hypothetical protein
LVPLAGHQEVVLAAFHQEAAVLEALAAAALEVEEQAEAGKYNINE